MAFLAFSNPEASVPRNSGPFLSIRDFVITQVGQDLDFTMPDSPKCFKLSDHQLKQQKAACLAKVDEIFPDGACRWAPSTGSSIILDHVDFSPHNIRVSKERPFRILTVLDWEGARTVPIWAARPRWVWPQEMSREEKDRFEAIMKEVVASRCPEWELAMSEEFRVVRSVWEQARRVSMDPKVVHGSLKKFLLPK